MRISRYVPFPRGSEHRQLALQVVNQSVHLVKCAIRIKVHNYPKKKKKK